MKFKVSGGCVEGVITLHTGSDPDNMARRSTFRNLVTNAGLRAMWLTSPTGATNRWAYFCRVGSGSREPAPTDTELQNLLRTTSTIQAENVGVNNTDPSAPYVYYRNRYRFEPSGSSYNVSELGVGSSSTLTNRALVRDDDTGLPTSIAVLGDEYLDVTVEFRLYPNISDTTGTFTPPAGADQRARQYTIRPGDASGQLSHGIGTFSNVAAGSTLALALSLNDAASGAFSTAIGPLFTTPSGSKSLFGSTGGSGYSSALDPVQSKAVCTWTAGLNSLNGSIKTIWASIGMGTWQIEFDIPFEKTNEDIFVFELEVEWGRK